MTRLRQLSRSQTRSRPIRPRPVAQWRPRGAVRRLARLLLDLLGLEQL